MTDLARRLRAIADAMEGKDTSFQWTLAVPVLRKAADALDAAPAANPYEQMVTGNHSIGVFAADGKALAFDADVYKPAAPLSAEEIEKVRRWLRKYWPTQPPFTPITDTLCDMAEAYLASRQQEPDGEVVAGTGDTNDLVVIKWCSSYRPHIGDKIYAAPQGRVSQVTTTGDAGDFMMLVQSTGRQTTDGQGPNAPVGTAAPVDQPDKLTPEYWDGLTALVRNAPKLSPDDKTGDPPPFDEPVDHKEG